LDFGILGPVQVWHDRRPVQLGGTQRRCVLAVLLLQVGKVVPLDRLVERVWGEDEPARVRNAVQTHISRLRKAFAPDPAVQLAAKHTGYVLQADPQTVDVCRFRRLLAEARATSDLEQSALLFGTALDLWRGRPLADVAFSEAMQRLSDGLEEERSTALEERIAVDLRLGRHATVLNEVSTLATEHPLRERLCALWILALYRCGRQAEALAVYQRTRARLAEELGIEPSPPLQRLHQRILTADPELATTVPSRAPTPQQLPAAPRFFTGRGRELETLGTGTGTVTAICGTGGIGKTWLALHWAHQHFDRFPDGQLHVNLRGFAPVGQPVAPETAVRGFLDALGVDPAGVPADPQAQVGLYRSLVAGKRMLIVLDNARDTAQVAPLLPGSPSCTVLVTSRDRMPGLVTGHGARPIALDVLGQHDARQLLTRHLGASRVDAEPGAAQQLLTCCAGLPLAISVVVARALDYADFPLSVLAGELCEARLDALDAGDQRANVRAALSWSCRALTPAALTAFGFLGLVTGPDISLPTASALIGVPVAQGRTILRELENAYLVQQHQPGRYRMHDLIRLCAAEQADLHGAEPALKRLAGFYLHTAAGGDLHLDPHRFPLDLGQPPTGVLALDDGTAALAWFTAEHANLLATQRLAAGHGWHELVWQLASTLDTFHRHRAHLHDNLEVWQAASTAAENGGGPSDRALAYRLLGSAQSRLGMHEKGLRNLDQALAYAERASDLPGLAHTHHLLGGAWELQDDDRKALEHATQALDLFQRLDMPAWEAWVLDQVGWHQARLGRHAEARTNCERALVLARRHGDRETEATTLDSLGYAAHRAGQHADALDHYDGALTLFRALGHRYHEADTLEHIGQAQHELGHAEPARAAWLQALELYRLQLRIHDADRVLRQLVRSASRQPARSKRLPRGSHS
jgi:DNA-binding SARP family transcriptional activator/tetratricopeptide (TPR) repeat protein